MPRSRAILINEMGSTPLDPGSSVGTHGTHGRRAAARRGRHSPSARSEVARPTTTTTDGRRRRARSCGVRYRLAEETIEPNPTAGRAAPACAVMRCPQDRQGADEMRHAPSRGHGVGMGNSGSDRQMPSAPITSGGGGRPSRRER